jgi:hypothetical protein
MHRQWFGGIAVALAVALCGPPTAAQQMPQQVAQAATDNVIASAQYSNDPDLRCDLLEVKRVSGGALMVRWRIVNTAGQSAAGGGFASSSPGKAIRYTFHWEELFFIDPGENKKYLPLTDSANKQIAQVYEGDLAPGQQRLSWAKFPAPPANSTKISVTIPHFAPFEDAPVAQ